MVPTVRTQKKNDSDINYNRKMQITRLAVVLLFHMLPRMVDERKIIDYLMQIATISTLYRVVAINSSGL
jgi:hypothetical protein